MRLLTFVDSVLHFKGFVFDRASLVDNNNTLVIGVRPHKRNRHVCSGCSRKGGTYDHRTLRTFEHVPLWDRTVHLEYLMRRVNCPRCGVKVERVPWATGKQRMTDDFRHFLSTWARRVTWSEVALYFRTSWNTVYRAVRSTVEWGLENRVLSEPQRFIKWPVRPSCSRRFLLRRPDCLRVSM